MTTADWREARGALADAEQWREVTFAYRVPDGGDAAELEDAMIEACAQVIGCDAEEGDTADTHECPASWVASSRPLPDEDDA